MVKVRELFRDRDATEFVIVTIPTVIIIFLLDIPQVMDVLASVFLSMCYFIQA